MSLTKKVHITYQQLYEQVCQLANGLSERGVQKGDRVRIYTPMTQRRHTQCSPVPALVPYTALYLAVSRRNRCKIEYSDSDCQMVIDG